MPDPRVRDPHYPDRPTHPDYVRLSEVAQAHDALAEQLNVPVPEILGIDEESFFYFLKHRLGIASQSLHRDFNGPKFAALYLDAFALGKAYAENLAREQREES